MRLYLINPSNPLVSLVKLRESFWNRFRVWKPLSLMVLAGLTPRNWDITIFDENRHLPDYQALPRPDLVGITAFTSQASRAYELAAHFRGKGVPVIMGGIHATMCIEEAAEHVDCVVAGEAETVWPQVLDDFRNGQLQRRYDAAPADMGKVPPPRHDLLKGYFFGAIQTTRGCPLNCTFCSVTAFNGARYRHRPISEVIDELKAIRERAVLIVDDNLIGTRFDHIERAKELFRTMIAEKVRKRWIAQVTVNFADDPELLRLAYQAGCRGVYIGFESPSMEGLAEVGKKFNILKGADFRGAVQRIRRHKIQVVGSFILGLDVDKPGIGRCIAEAADQYGVDYLSLLLLTPLPGTRLWHDMAAEDRIALNRYPTDWKYYTLTFPVARYKHLTMDAIIEEAVSCNRRFYAPGAIARRIWDSLRHFRKPLATLAGNLAYYRNLQFSEEAYAAFKANGGGGYGLEPPSNRIRIGSVNQPVQEPSTERLESVT